MTTSFSSLPIVDLTVLSKPDPTAVELTHLSDELCNVFTTTGFAYLINAPLSFNHEDVFRTTSDFFRLSEEEKLRLAKRTFVRENKNTYRGYFPPQPGQQDNLKEGFEVGPSEVPRRADSNPHPRFTLAEPNVWPSEALLGPGRREVEKLHRELQKLSATLLALLAVALRKPVEFFAPYLVDSLSTLRLLHYPPQKAEQAGDEAAGGLCCTPHTDSGILTLLHQDQTGGLEVLNADGDWVAAPYVPGSVVVNIGDLMAKVSGGRFVATMHRVRTTPRAPHRPDGMGRFSVPFFFEPGEHCVVRSVDGGEGIVYGDYVRKKMDSWIEYQDVPKGKLDEKLLTSAAVEAC